MIDLNNGLKIPHFGLGLYRMTESEMQAVLPTYSQTCQMMHVDGAAVYRNQCEFAKVIKSLDIPRSRLFIADKLWDSQHGDVEGACKETLNRLNINHLDLYLIHWPFSMQPSQEDPLSAKRDNHNNPVPIPNLCLSQVWRQMEGLVDKGLVKSIGISNFTKQNVQSILDTCRIKPAVLQIEVHPWLPQDELVSFCQQSGIVVEAYSPLGTSLLLHHPVVMQIAKEVRASAAQVLLAFGRQRGLVTLCKTGSPARLQENLKTDLSLSDDQMTRLHNLQDPSKRLFHPKDWYGSKYEHWV